MILTIVLIAIFFLICFKLSILKPKDFPPGPPWIPIVGSLLDLKKALQNSNSHSEAFSQLSKNWKTNILGLKLGAEVVVVVEDFPTIRYILNNKEYDQRPLNFFTKLRNMGTSLGITCGEGTPWIEQKIFLTRYLNTISNKDLDFNITKEVQNLAKEINCKEAIDITNVLPRTLINILWSIVAGKQIGPEKNQFLDIMLKRNKAFDISGGYLAYFPWLRFIIPEKSRYNLIKTLNKKLKKFLMATIEEHELTWTENNHSDFIYSYITKKKMENKQKFHLSREQLFFVCLDLFIGGYNTTAYTLEFLFLMMILHQDVQKKIHTILNETFAKNQVIEYQDRYKVPYVEAVIKEVQRFRPVAPIFGPRRTAQKTTLNGYTIPKNTTILMNLNSTWTNKDVWSDPEVFKPERFLNNFNKLSSKLEFIPFGLGRRKCPGNTLAQRSLFLITSEILRQYEVLPVDENNLPTDTPSLGLVRFPLPFYCKFKKID